MDKKRAFIFHLFALVIVLGLLSHALQERARLMEPAPAPLDEEFIRWNATIRRNATVPMWQPPPGELNISQVTVEVDGKRMFFEDDGKDYVDMTHEMDGGR